ncbi:MAG: hypothetical protein ACR65T_17015 [Methylocystis sp.]|uniref:hypothetical protein n=1 Tax=Methylocystis sp. TaxID=1911079 RepID=UPI003DA32E71
MEAVATIAPRRHVWLDRLIAAPEAEVRALVEGTADIHPFGRAEPSDAAATLLFGLSGDDPASHAFDEGALAALETYRKTLPRITGAQRDRIALAALDLMTVVQRLAPRNTVVDFHRRFPYWNNWAETLVIDQGLDLRREYWRVLALTQDIAEEAGLAARRLLPFWLSVCGEAGQRGAYDETYLTVGLLGLRRLPLEEGGANEEAALHGLARWAEAQRPDKKRFLREWRVLEGAFPRDPTFWTPLVARVLESVESELSRRTNHTQSTFLAAHWWREDLDLIRGAKVDVPDSWISPPDRSLHETVLDGIRNERPFRTLQIAQLVAKHQRYAARTGDTYYLVRTACNVGMKLLKGGDEPVKRARTARDLAQLAQRFEPSNVYAWALWRDALAAMGHLDAAERVGWETLRRFPENEQWRNQLALLLSDRVGRGGEAEALLRETMRLFPRDVVARTQLADIVGRESARLPEAIGILEGALGIEPEDRIANDMKQRFEQGRTSKPRPVSSTTAIVAERAEGDSDDLPPHIATTARARRALFQFRNGQTDAVAEVRRLLDEDENLAYARYVAAAVGVIEPSIDNTVLAAAFLAAAKAGSAAALRPFLDRAWGVDAVIISLAGAARGDMDAASNVRFWLAEPANDLQPRDANIRAIAARPAASIPTELLADMLAASQGIAIAA